MSHFLFRNGSGNGDGSGEINIVDNLESTSITSALSGNQGRVLKELIDNHEEKTILSEDGVHGLRFFNGKLQIFEEPNWVDALEEDISDGFTLLHRDTYISYDGNKTYNITLPNYTNELPTIVSRNGIILPPTDYTIVDNKVTLNILDDDSLVQFLVFYNTDPEILTSIEEIRDVYVSNGESTFTITSNKFNQSTPLVVSRNGIILVPSDYTVNGNQVTINDSTNGTLIQLMTWYKIDENDNSPLNLHRDVYTQSIGLTDFEITSDNYNPLFPTIVTRGGTISPTVDYHIVNENGKYIVRFNEVITTNPYIQIFAWEGMTGNKPLVLSVNGKIGHVNLTNEDVNAPSKQEFEELKTKAVKVITSDTPPVDTNFIWEDTSV